jgi:gliding motility-associated-like protein
MNKTAIILQVFSFLFLFNIYCFSQYAIYSNVSFFLAGQPEFTNKGMMDSFNKNFLINSNDFPAPVKTYLPRDTNYALSGNCIVNAKFSPGQDTVVMNGNPVLLTNQSTNAISYSWYINGSYASSVKDITIYPVIGVNEIMLVASNGTCSDSVSSYIIWHGADSGAAAILKKQFNPPGMSIDPFCIASDKANGYLLAGDYFPPVRDNFGLKTTCLIHINEDGCVTWSKAMTAGEEEVIQSIISTSDTGFLVSAFPFQSETANYPKFLIVFKLNKQGDIEWSHSYSSGASVNNYYSAMCEIGDKGFALEMGSFPSEDNPSFLSIIKVDQQGRFTWGRKLSIGDNSLYNIGGIIEKNGFIYATGSVYQDIAPFQLLRSFVTQLDIGTGTTNWTKQNDPVQPPVTFTDVHDYRNGLLINSFTANALSDLIYTDNDGNVLSAHIVNNPYGSLKGGENILVTPGNDLYFHQFSGLPMVAQKDIIMRLDSDQQILWQHDFYSENPGFASWFQLSPAPSNGVAGIGSGKGTNGFEVLTFLKLDSTGASCSTGTSDLSVAAITSSLVPMTWNINTNLAMDVTDLSKQLKTLSVDSRLFCPKFANGCDLLKLEGTKSICELTDTARYILHSDPACGDPITWMYDSLHISVLSKNNTGMEIKFKSEGSYIIKVEKKGCNLLTDSIAVTVGDHISDVHLPGDTILCSGNDLVLDAGNGYSSYQWQDGSTGQSIRVSTPGIYWVRLTTPNDCISTDTTIISAIDSLPAHFLPADTVICSYTSFLIKPTQAYFSYLWSTGETNADIQIKNPGVYTLRVVDSNGCTGSDTIRVNAKNCPYRIYFPNAFTPNQDGHNDLYKPIIVGDPVIYHFSIYNRWGQLIFDTNDPWKGWDGKIAGQDQESSAYVWVCVYQFGGEKENNVRGNFILIR